MRGRMLYDGEWVKVTNLKNKRFNASSPCSMCGEFKVKPVWFNINNKEVKCLSCFTPQEYRD
jgi:formylmethanofuran dehydrogenase subunit E